MATRADVIEVLQQILDPEIYVDIWTLGLIYDIEIKESELAIKMTFTSMACPMGPELVAEVQARCQEIPGVEKVVVEVVFDPPWTPSEELKAMMGIA